MYCILFYFSNIFATQTQKKRIMATQTSKNKTIYEVKELVKYEGFTFVTNKDKLLCLYQSTLNSIYKLTFKDDVIIWQKLIDSNSIKLEKDYKTVKKYCKKTTYCY